MNPEEILVPGETTTTISSKIIRETNVTDAPWVITLKVRVADRKVLEAHCTCYVGRLAKCKHVAALYSYVNEERSEVCNFKHGNVNQGKGFTGRYVLMTFANVPFLVSSVYEVGLLNQTSSEGGGGTGGVIA